MEVNFATGENISLKSTHSTYEYPLATSGALNVSTRPATFVFLLNTHLLFICFLPSGNPTRSHVSLFLNDSISSSIAFFQSSPSIESIASFTILGSSSSMEDNAKFERKLGGLYLLGCFIAHLELFMTRVWVSTSSLDLTDSFESWLYLFQLNSSFLWFLFSYFFSLRSPPNFFEDRMSIVHYSPSS